MRQKCHPMVDGMLPGLAFVFAYIAKNGLSRRKPGQPVLLPREQFQVLPVVVFHLNETVTFSKKKISNDTSAFQTNLGKLQKFLLLRM